MACWSGGDIELAPNHAHSAVGPMAGTISPSSPVWVVENRAFGNRAYCRQVEGRLQFGDYGPEALDGLRRWRDVWAPTIARGAAADRRAGAQPDHRPGTADGR